MNRAMNGRSRLTALLSALLIPALLVAGLALPPLVQQVEANWTDRGNLSGPLAAATLPTPTLTQCQYKWAAFGRGDIQISWQLPATYPRTGTSLSQGAVGSNPPGTAISASQVTTVDNGNGSYTTTFSGGNLSTGKHTVWLRAEVNGWTTPYAAFTADRDWISSTCQI